MYLVLPFRLVSDGVCGNCAFVSWQLCIDSLCVLQSSFVNHDSFLLPFPLLILFISFAYLNALTRTSRTVH